MKRDMLHPTLKAQNFKPLVLYINKINFLLLLLFRVLDQNLKFPSSPLFICMI